LLILSHPIPKHTIFMNLREFNFFICVFSTFFHILIPQLVFFLTLSIIIHIDSTIKTANPSYVGWVGGWMGGWMDGLYVVSGLECLLSSYGTK
jgi:hypothetical protein